MDIFNFLGLDYRDVLLITLQLVVKGTSIPKNQINRLIYRTNFLKIIQGGRRHQAVYYTCPQSFLIKFSYSLALQLQIFDWFVPCAVECPNVQTTNCTYKRGNLSINSSAIVLSLQIPDNVRWQPLCIYLTISTSGKERLPVSVQYTCINPSKVKNMVPKVKKNRSVICWLNNFGDFY